MNIAYFIKPKNTVEFVYSDSTVRQTIEKMKFHGYSAIPVLSHNGRYFGTVSEGDLLYSSYMASRDTIEKTPVSEIINKDRFMPVSIFADIDELVSVLVEQNFVPVTDDRGCFMGIVTRRDMLRYYKEKAGKSETENEKETKQDETE